MRAMRISLLIVTIAVLFGLAGSPSAHTAQANTQGHCSLATLHGRYGGVWTGLIYPGPPPKNPQVIGKFVPYDGMEVSRWDGAGNFAASDVFAVGGTPGSPAEDKGTYTVSANCTGTLTLTNGLTFDFIILRNGDEIRFAETDGYPTVVIEDRM
jgi:hypothetical protein